MRRNKGFPTSSSHSLNTENRRRIAITLAICSLDYSQTSSSPRLPLRQPRHQSPRLALPLGPYVLVKLEDLVRVRPSSAKEVAYRIRLMIVLQGLENAADNLAA